MQTMPDKHDIAERELAEALSQPSADRHAGSLGAAIVRVALGVTIVATWWSNVTGDLYTADGLKGFFNWLYTSAENGGNGSSLGFVDSFLNSVIAPIAGPFGIAQGVLELALGLALVFGIATRAAALGAVAFFASIFLAYFGGEEWIWTYVLLIAGSLAVFFDFGGRKFGIDQLIVAKRGDTARNLIF